MNVCVWQWTHPCICAFVFVTFTFKASGWLSYLDNFTCRSVKTSEHIQFFFFPNNFIKVYLHIRKIFSIWQRFEVHAHFDKSADKFSWIRDMNHLVSQQNVTRSNQYCRFYFMFYYISALSVSRSKFYQQACALSAYQTAIIQHACHILFSLHLPQQTQWDNVFLNIYSAVVLCLTLLICRFTAFISFVQSETETLQLWYESQSRLVYHADALEN